MAFADAENEQFHEFHRFQLYSHTKLSTDQPTNANNYKLSLTEFIAE